MNRILEYIDYEDYAYGDYAPMIERVYKKLPQENSWGIFLYSYCNWFCCKI